LFRLVERERTGTRHVVDAFRSGALRPFPRPPGGSSAKGALDCLHAAHDISLDPRTGTTRATLDLEVSAVGRPLAAVGLAFDQGPRVTAVSASGRTAAATDGIYVPTRMVTIGLSPALPAGASTMIHVAYEGTLSCGNFPSSGAVVCTKGQDFSAFPN